MMNSSTGGGPNSGSADQAAQLPSVSDAAVNGARHDLGLYEAAGVIGIFVFLMVTSSRKRSASTRRAGVTTECVLVMYGASRFLLEFLRGDDIDKIGRHSDPRYWGLTLVQYAAALMMMGGAYLSKSVGRGRNDG